MDSLRTQSLNEIARPGKPQRVEGLIDVNLLPRRYERARLRMSTVLAWLALIALIGLLVPSYQQWQAASTQLTARRAAFAQVQAEMAAINPDEQARANLQAQIDDAQARATDLRSAAVAIAIQDVQWGSTLAAIRGEVIDGLRLTSIHVTAGAVEINGDARAYSLPLAYADALRQNGDYLGVIVGSISKVELTPEQQAELATAGTVPDADAANPSTSEEPVVRFAFQIIVVVQQPASSPQAGDTNGNQ
jgi:hypothetical protein